MILQRPAPMPGVDDAFSTCAEHSTSTKRFAVADAQESLIGSASGMRHETVQGLKASTPAGKSQKDRVPSLPFPLVIQWRFLQAAFRRPE